MNPRELPNARELMATPAFVIHSHGDLLDAIDQLIAHQLPAAPVVDDRGKLCGMLTEKDCLRVLSSLTYDPEPGRSLVARYQSPVRTVCEPTMDLFRIAEIFLSNNFPILPVVEGDELVGTLSRGAMLRGIQILRSMGERHQQQFEQSAGRQADRPRSIEALQRAAASSSRDQLTSLLGRKNS